jgi:hypothetical protein
MANYYLNEAAFTLPDVGFVDRTVHVLEARLPGGDSLGFLVTRRPLAVGKSLRDMAQEHLHEDARRLTGFAILEEAETTVAGAPAISFRSRWRHSGDVLYQRQVHLAALEVWMLFAMTAPLSERELCDRAFDMVLSSLVFRTS